MTLYSRDAEVELLAAIFHHGAEALVQAQDHVQDATPFSPSLRPIAEVLITLARERTPPNPVACAATAAALGFKALAEGMQARPLALSEDESDVLFSVGSLGSVPFHAKVVADMYRRRELIEAGAKLQQAAQDMTIPVQASYGAIVDHVTPRITAVRGEVAKDWLLEAIEDVEREVAQVGLPGITTGFPRLDDLTDGWCPGRLVVVAARPGFGKTATGIWFADAAARGGEETYFATLEQPTRVLQRRRLQARSGIDIRALRDRHWEREEQIRVLRSLANDFRGEPLTFFEGLRTVREIRMELQRRIATGAKPRLLVIDYLTLLKPDGKHDRHDLAVGQLATDLQRLAIELGLTVIALAQLNRESVKDGKMRRPSVADLRDSGIIEQAADQLILLWPGAVQDDVEPTLMDRTSGIEPFEMLLDKNRHGPKGTVKLEWWQRTGRFVPEQVINHRSGYAA